MLVQCCLQPQHYHLHHSHHHPLLHPLVMMRDTGMTKATVTTKLLKKKTVAGGLGKWTTNVCVNSYFYCLPSLLDLCISTQSALENRVMSLTRAVGQYDWQTYVLMPWKFGSGKESNLVFGFKVEVMVIVSDSLCHRVLETKCAVAL